MDDMAHKTTYCEYCRATPPEGGSKEVKVIHQRDGRVVTTTFTVCAKKGKGCGGYLQMAYEG